jgi:mRNA-decapping enzyme subunit 2
LPTWRRNKTAAGRFYLISPFIGCAFPKIFSTLDIYFRTLRRALKAFINERRPRGGPRKTARPKKPLPAQMPLVSKGKPQHHDAIHESSSQSSSAENGEPHTPSPHYTEPLANPISHIVEDEIIKADTTVTGMDPHFARLLSSLTMSASSLSHDLDGKKGVVVTPLMKANSPEYKNLNLPVSAPKPSRASPSALPQTDWSASAPSGTSPQVNSLTPSSKLPSPSLQPPISPSRSDQTYDEGSLHLTNDVELNRVNYLSQLDTSSSTSGSTVKARSVVPHRTTDLSPYPPPPAEHHTSAKILKQLALLEAVADESARMSPFLAHTAPSSNLTIANYNARISSSPSSVPPPPMISYNSNNHRVIYTSSTAVQPSTAHTAPHMLNGIPLAQDPFQVRSKTSHTYHRGPLGGPSGSLSMNQSQLLALMSGPRAASQTPHIYSQPPSFQGMHLPPFYTPMPGAIRPPPAQKIVHPLPPSPFPPRMNPTPYGGPSMSSGIYAPPRIPYPASGSLLSILNSNRGSSGIPFNPATSPQMSHNGRTP